MVHVNAHAIRLGLAVGLGLLMALVAAACGGDDGPPQTTATAVTGATTTLSTTDPPDQGSSDAARAGTTTADAATEATEAQPLSDQEQIATMLKRIFVAGDAKRTCEELVTERYVRRSYGDLKGCIAAQSPKAMADSISISGIDADLGSGVAQASITADGGVYAGERLRAELVKTDGGWQLDGLRTNVPVGP